MKRKRGPSKMEDLSSILSHSSEFIPGRLFFVTLNTYGIPKSTPLVHFFSVETSLCYDSFYDDFGPLNLSVLYHYCGKLDWKLSNSTLKNKKIVHYVTAEDDKNRVNAAFLIGAYAIIKLNYDPERAYDVLTRTSKKKFIDFRDASVGDAYTVSLLDCLRAVKRALDCGFFDFKDFDFFEYEHYERVENGDLNWIVPEKFIAFCGPHDDGMISINHAYSNHSPESYFAYFRRHNVTTVIRLNNKAYDSNRFIQAGFDHKDLFFVDGGIPNDRILDRFIYICENSKGAIAVHCKAGLGRTGTLIACYIMKHYRFTAQEAIAWIRFCRPGSIIAHQQTWLHQKQEQLWAAGEEYRQRHKVKGPIKHKVGIYGLASMNNNKNKSNDNMTRIMKKVHSMEINDSDEDCASEDEITQGDKLNEIKAHRAKSKTPLANMTGRKTFRTKVLVNASSTSPVRVGRIITNTSKSTTSTTRVLTKRNEMNEGQTTRRCSQRKLNAALLSAKEKNKIPEVKPLPKKKENLNWLLKNGPTLHETNMAKCSTDNKVENTIKRGKRTLALEKDKASPHSVKVLRRSHGHTSRDAKKGDGKLHLPSVMVNKTL